METDEIAVLERALRHIKEARPDASPEKQVAFARSIMYLVTGFMADGWPSVRELYIHRIFCGGRLSLKDACDLLLDGDSYIFAPMGRTHRELFEEELTAGNDAEDLAVLASSNG